MKPFLLALLAVNASAAHVTIASYNIQDAAMSGLGAWAHTYNGTITPGSVFSSAAGGFERQANYSGGSGTLNDGVISESEQESQLFVIGPVSGGSMSMNPIITLILDGIYTINSVKVYGGPTSNTIPGCLAWVSFGIGGGGQAIESTPFGGGNCGGINDLFTITGSSMDGLATNTITMFGFSGPLAANSLFSITEIEVDGTAVPEPTTIVLTAIALGALCTRRRR